MTEANPATQRMVRWWHLVVPILVVPAALMALGIVFAVVLVAAKNAGYDIAFSPADLLKNPATQFWMAQLVLIVVYVPFAVVLRALLGRPGRTRMVADFTPARMGVILFGIVVGVALAVGAIALTAWLQSLGVDFKNNDAVDEVMPHSAV